MATETSCSYLLYDGDRGTLTTWTLWKRRRQTQQSGFTTFSPTSLWMVNWACWQGVLAPSSRTRVLLWTFWLFKYTITWVMFAFHWDVSVPGPGVVHAHPKGIALSWMLFVTHAIFLLCLLFNYWTCQPHVKGDSQGPSIPYLKTFPHWRLVSTCRHHWLIKANVQWALPACLCADGFKRNQTPNKGETINGRTLKQNSCE